MIAENLNNKILELRMKKNFQNFFNPKMVKNQKNFGLEIDKSDTS